MKSCKECGDTYYAKEYCVKHYFKSRRTTTRELIAEDAECVVEGCETRPRARGHCPYHYNVMMGYTKSAVPNKSSSGRGRKKKEIVGYRAAHIRVEAVKGKAEEHDCVACGEPAQEWSLDPLAVHTYEEDGRVWSLNTDDYDPYCCSCHRDRDGGYAWDDNLGYN